MEHVQSLRWNFEDSDPFMQYGAFDVICKSCFYIRYCGAGKKKYETSTLIDFNFNYHQLHIWFNQMHGIIKTRDSGVISGLIDPAPASVSFSFLANHLPFRSSAFQISGSAGLINLARVGGKEYFRTGFSEMESHSWFGLCLTNTRGPSRFERETAIS